MGDIADYYRDQEYGEEAAYFASEREADEISDKYKRGILKWAQKNTEEILVIKMTDTHIVNAYKMLKKIDEKDKSHDPIHDAWIQVFMDEVTKREIEIPKSINHKK